MDLRTRLEPGHPACAGCGAAIAMKIASAVVPSNTRVVIPASCWSIILGKYPFSSLKLPVIHTPFALASAFATGMRAAKSVPVMVWAGDGATYDIGFGLLSAAAERNEDIVYVCYDNEAYMNTGGQKSSATPKAAKTPTTPQGKETEKKDIIAIMKAHKIPYIATASIAFPEDLQRKIKKAFSIKGFSFILIHSPCPTGWKMEPSLTVKASRMAVESGIFKLVEIKHGQERETYKPTCYVNPREYYKLQGRMPRDE